MFALEITFADDPNNVEFLLVKRPRFSLGAAEEASVTVKEMAQLGFDLEVTRGVGGSFSCKPIVKNSAEAGNYKFLSNTYNDNAAIDLGPVSFRITTLESDLIVRESDTPDKAAARIFRQSLAFESPRFPAWIVVGNSPIVMSFSPDQSILIGRSNKCLLRLDATDISNEHARLGFESGQFWVEDLGSSNGTFIDGSQLSGRQEIDPETRVMIGGHTVIVGVNSKEQLSNILNPGEVTQKSVAPAPAKAAYPVVISQSELMRPARFTLQAGSNVVVGREPDNDIWIGAPHISRKHFSIAVSKTGEISITDMSRNGMAWSQGILPRNQPFVIKTGGNIFDLGGGVTVAICNSKEEEDAYKAMKGEAVVKAAPPKKAIPEPLSEQPVLTPPRPEPRKISHSIPVTAGQPSSGRRDHQFGSQKPVMRSKLGLWMLLLSGAIVGVVVVLLLLHRFK